MKSCGVVYVAIENHELEAAFLSAHSVKRFCPELAVTVFAGSGGHPLCQAGVFDDVRATSGASHLRCLAAAPYDATLYLANDTRLLVRELPGLFSMLERADVAMAEAAPDVSTLARHLGHAVFDSGVIFYRRSANVAAWLSAWCEATDRNRALARQAPVSATGILAPISDAESRRELLTLDQTSLAEGLTPQGNRFGLTAQTLPYAWNHTDSRMPSLRAEVRKLRHSPAFLASAREELLALACAWARAGRGAESDRLYRYLASREKQPGPFDAGSQREAWSTDILRNTDLHLRRRQTEIARQLLSQVPDNDVSYSYALAGRARIALQEGQLDTARTVAVAAARLKPDSPYVRAVEGIALIAAGGIQDAIAPLDLAARAGSITAAFHLGNAYRQLGDPTAAAAAYRRTLELDPDHREAHGNLVAVLLRSRRYQDALATADALLAKQPWHVPALAQKCIAYQETGDDAAARALADFDRFTQCEQIEVPTGFANLRDFNSALGRVLRADPTLARDPSAHATRAGWHTGDLTGSPAPEVQALIARIQEVVDRRMRTLPTGDHPFLAAVPRVFRLHCWAIVMDEGGHQVPHIHGSGWLSGVYYVDVPDEVVDDDPDHKGWLSFGRGDPRWHRDTTLISERFVRPQPGLLVTFPSFFWHGTVPLRTAKRRISFAFDVNPAQAWQPS